MSRRVARRRRRGTVIIAALALLLLAAGLLASSALVASASSASALRARSAAAAEATARRALARALAEWSPAFATLDVGASSERAVVARADDLSADLPSAVRVRVQRLSALAYMVAVDVRVGVAGRGARRRVGLIVQLPAAADGTVTGDAPRPLARWSIADLY